MPDKQEVKAAFTSIQLIWVLATPSLAFGPIRMSCVKMKTLIHQLPLAVAISRLDLPISQVPQVELA